MSEKRQKAGAEPTGTAPATAEAYDALVARLEKVVGELEGGGLTLEASIEKFAEGVQLAREASRKLDEAERRIDVLVRNSDGSLSEKPLEERKEGAEG